MFLTLPRNKRTIEEVARLQGVRVRLRGEWSRRFRWRDRARSYDAYIDQLQRESIERKAMALQEERIDVARKVVKRAARDLGRTKRTLTPFEQARLMEVAARLGEPGSGIGERGGVRLENVLIAVAAQRTDPRTVTD